MPHRQYSVLVTNNHSSRTWRVTLSRTAVRLLILLAGLLVALLVGAVLLARAGMYRSARLSYLELRNRQLEEEFGRVAELRHRLARLEEMERRYAEMLGVELTPPPVDWLSAGVDTTDGTEQDLAEKWGSRPVPAVIPVDEFVLSRSFDRHHPGVDLAARSGTPVRAAADGVVFSRGTDSVFGNYLQLTHLEGFETYYAHLLDWRSGPGDSVRAGQVVGLVGSTGRSSAPHLHFEIRRYGEPLDPGVLLRFR